MKKIWNQLGHSLFAEDESSRKTKHILKTVFFFYILVPVSYTHLDVYKRQVEGTGKPMVVRREKQGLLDGFKEAK